MSDVRLTRRGRFAIVGVVVVVVIAILGVAAVGLGHHFRGGSSSSSSKDYTGDGTGKVTVQVQSGDSVTTIGQRLVDAGVVASVGAWVKVANGDTRSTNIQPGFYSLHSHMSAESALDLILTPAAKVQSGFTIPEGTSLKNVPGIISRGTGIPVAQIQAAIANPAALGLPAYANGSVEGFLFPATYVVTPGESATAVLQAMVKRFEQAAADTNLEAGAQALGITPLQVITIASVIQRETASPADGPKVARVFYNRLANKMGLGSEFTVAYAGGDAKSPYNTYTNKGYPPGPYDSPGEQAIQSALNPTPGPWLFFVTLPKEGTQFVTTESDFFALQKKCQDEGGCKS